jgi:hypothetical protein
MRIDELRELHYITPFANVPSILQTGILSHNKAAAIKHDSVADEQVQDRRRGIRVSGGLKLHDYANLYFHARNAMMSRRRGHRDELCVLVVDPAVINLPGAVVADRNAASGDALFRPAPRGIEGLDAAYVFAEWWTQSREAKQRRCAEVLIPHVVPAEFVRGAYVHDETTRVRMAQLVPDDFPVSVDSHLFFGSGAQP